MKGLPGIPLAPGHQAKMSPILSNGVTSEEVDEAIIRTIFLKNKRNELFIQQSPELAKRYVFGFPIFMPTHFHP